MKSWMVIIGQLIIYGIAFIIFSKQNAKERAAEKARLQKWEDQLTYFINNIEKLPSPLVGCETEVEYYDIRDVISNISLNQDIRIKLLEEI